VTRRCLRQWHVNGTAGDGEWSGACRYVYGDAVKVSVSTVSGLGPWEWALPLSPGSGAAVTAWLDGHAVDDRRRPRPSIRVRSTLIRRRDRSGTDYFVLARPLRPISERLYLRVVADSVAVMQVMPKTGRAYFFVFFAVTYAFGLGGVIAAIAGDPGALLLLMFPVFVRVLVVPMVRGRVRDYAHAYLAKHVSGIGRER
jgi:hypothetical protein